MNDRFMRFIHSKNDVGGNPLLLAAEKRYKEVVESLINGGSDINRSHYRSNYTVLHYASENGWLEIVQTLLNKGADIQVKTKNGDSPLLLAASNSHKEIVELLMNAGADINCSDNWYKCTVLHYASENGWPEIVQSLLNNGADIQIKTKCGDSPLLLAASKRHKDIVKLLIDAGADINCSDTWFHNTVLHYAAKNEWLDVVQSLLKKGANIQVKTKRGGSPLLLAAEKKQKDIVELLLNAGADIDCTESWDNYTLLHYVSENGWLDVVQSLLEKGADIQIKTKHGDSPLLLAASNCHKDIVEFLINAGADINCCDSWDNCTVLHYASENGWLEIVQFLLNNGADIQLKTKRGDSPLFLAAKKRHQDIVKLLINAGAEINCSEMKYNYTVLHYAAKNGWLEILKSLLKKGANIEAKSDSGKTSLQIALDCKEIEIVEYLIKTGADINVENNNGNSPLSNLIRLSPDIKLIRLLIKNGAYIKSIDFKRIIGNSFLKEQILQDIELCSQAIINKFDHKDLPDLYKVSLACNILPSIENMRIGNNSQVADNVLQSVKHEIQEKGHCNILEARPLALKMMSVKSFFSYWDNIKKLESTSNQMKRAAEFSYDIPYSAHSSNKIMRFNTQYLNVD